MTDVLTSPGATKWPPGPMPQAARGAPPQSDAFAGILDLHQARTATAEGRTETDERAYDRADDVPAANVQADRRRDDERVSREDRDRASSMNRDDDREGERSSVNAGDRGERTRTRPSDERRDRPAKADDSSKPAEDGAPAAAGTAVDGDKQATSGADPAVPSAGTGAAQPAATAATAPSAVLLALLTAPVASAATPATPAAGAAIASPQATTAAAATAPATDQGTAAELPAAADPNAGQAPAPGLSTGGPGTQVAAATQGQGGGTAPDGDKPGQGGQPKQDPATAQAAQLPRTIATPAPGAEARVLQPQAAQQQQSTAAAASSAPASPVTAPASTAAPGAALRNGLPAATPVPLSRAAESVEAVLRVASQKGVTHARIVLRPAELGSVDVHLRSTSEGLVARVVAHSPEAVQTLQQAAGDLRRSLEEQGLTLLNLDIGQSGERSAGRSGSGEGGSAGRGRSGPDGLPADAGTETTTTETTLRLPNGVLVDVLA